MRNTIREKENRFWEYREAARLALTPQLAQMFPFNVVLTDINTEALRQAATWNSNPRTGSSSYVPWDWGQLRISFARRQGRLELAIWVESNLCGLVLGKVSEKKVIASIHYMQKNPEENPLSGHVAEIASLYLDAFGLILGCKETAIRNPIDPLIDYYKQLGFTRVVKKKGKIICLERDL